jgi:hypothetical protein
LNAASVVVTDGDIDTLKNLKYNVDRNRKEMEEDDNDNGGGDLNINNKNARTNTDATIFCTQLIWGKDLSIFLHRYGKQDIILAADCVYMVPSLQPLWDTVDALLSDDGVFIYTHTCASAVPWKDFKKQIEQHNFEAYGSIIDINRYDENNFTNTSTGSVDDDDNDDGKCTSNSRNDNDFDDDDDNNNDKGDSHESKALPPPPPKSTEVAGEFKVGIYIFRRRRKEQQRG